MFLDGLCDRDIYLIGYLKINAVLLYPDPFETSDAHKRIEIVNKFSEKLYNAGILSEIITNENHKEAGRQYPKIKTEKWMNKIEEFQNR